MEAEISHKRVITNNCFQMILIQYLKYIFVYIHTLSRSVSRQLPLVGLDNKIRENCINTLEGNFVLVCMDGDGICIIRWERQNKSSLGVYSYVLKREHVLVVKQPSICHELQITINIPCIQFAAVPSEKDTFRRFYRNCLIDKNNKTEEGAIQDLIQSEFRNWRARRCPCSCS